MKVSTLLFALSIAANLALAAVFVMGARAPASQAKNPAAAVGSKAARRELPASAAVGTIWNELESSDRRTQVEKLRADDFPPALIRAILAAQIRAEFANRRKALEAKQAELPFWRLANPDPGLQAELRALAKEEQQKLKDVLGPDRENGAGATLRRQFPNFPEDAIDQIAAIRERYDEQRMEIYSTLRSGSLLPDEQAKMAALDKAMHGEIAAVLTPQQLEDYDLRTSNTANSMRYNLAAFDPTEQEFRAIYKLQSAFDEKYNYRYGPSGADQMRARMDAQNQLNEDIKAALGATRYSEYQRATDYNYRQTTQLMARLNLPPETANSLYAVQKEFDERRMAVYRDSASAGAAGVAAVRERALALQQEAIARVTPILGNAARVDAYKSYGGSWIATMVPPMPRPPITSPTPPPKS